MNTKDYLLFDETKTHLEISQGALINAIASKEITPLVNHVEETEDGNWKSLTFIYADNASSEIKKTFGNPREPLQIKYRIPVSDDGMLNPTFTKEIFLPDLIFKRADFDLLVNSKEKKQESVAYHSIGFEQILWDGKLYRLQKPLAKIVKTLNYYQEKGLGEIITFDLLKEAGLSNHGYPAIPRYFDRGECRDLLRGKNPLVLSLKKGRYKLGSKMVYKPDL